MYSILMFVTIQTSAETTVSKLKRLDSINHVLHCSLYTHPSMSTYFPIGCFLYTTESE